MSTAPALAPGDDAEVVAVRVAGAFEQITLLAPHLAAGARPGQFAVLLRDPERDAHGLPRPVWVARVHADGQGAGARYGATVDVVRERDPRDPTQVGRVLPVLGPLGRAVPAPVEPLRVLLVGHEAAVVPLLWHALELTGRGCTVEVLQVLGSTDRHIPTVEVRRVCARVDAEVLPGDAAASATAAARLVTTRVGDTTHPIDLVVAAGPPDLVRAVLDAARTSGAAGQALLTPALPCSTGVCGGCDVDLTLPDGRRRTLRPCVHGPVVDAGIWPASAAAPVAATAVASDGPWLPGTAPGAGADATSRPPGGPS